MSLSSSDLHYTRSRFATSVRGSEENLRRMSYLLSWCRPWVGVRGLNMKLPKILYYLGSECVRRTHFKDVDPEKFKFILKFEMVHALCCALFVDYPQGKVWLLEESAIELLENNLQAPDILTPGGSVISICLLAQACRQALALPAEFLWERLDFCSQHRVRWAAHDKRGSFIKASE